MNDMAAGAAASDAGVIRIMASVAVGADETWSVVGDFAAAGRFSNTTCVIFSGDGGLGSRRRVGDVVVEKMVARGNRFYVYEQTEGPMATFGYHGCLAVEGDAAECAITRTIVYDASALEPGRRATEHASLHERFEKSIAAMVDAVVRGSAR